MDFTMWFYQMCIAQIVINDATMYFLRQCRQSVNVKVLFLCLISVMHSSNSEMNKQGAHLDFFFEGCADV